MMPVLSQLPSGGINCFLRPDYRRDLVDFPGVEAPLREIVKIDRSLLGFPSVDCR